MYIHAAFTPTSASPTTPSRPRHALQPAPLDPHAAPLGIRQLGKRILGNIEIPTGAADAAIDDLEIDGDGPVVAHAYHLATQRVLVGVGADGDGVEEEVGDGDDGVTVGGGEAAGAEARRVVGEIAGVGPAVGRGEGQVLGVVAVGEAGGEADGEGEERDGGDGDEDEGAA